MRTNPGGEQSPLDMEEYTMLGENFMDYTCHMFSETVSYTHLTLPTNVNV